MGDIYMQKMKMKNRLFNLQKIHRPGLDWYVVCCILPVARADNNSFEMTLALFGFPTSLWSLEETGLGLGILE